MSENNESSLKIASEDVKLVKKAVQKNQPGREEDNGFAEWGGYMNAKKAKLCDQFKSNARHGVKLSSIFAGVAILVNGYTNPTAEDLKLLMAQHGGIYHQYQMSNTTHFIASNLPNVKINNLGSIPIVKPAWIVDSVASGYLLDFTKYLLYTNHSHTQPKLNFAKLKNKGVDVDIEVQTALRNSILADKSASCAKTARDPEFLNDFYNNSRLHLISTLSIEFKQLINDLRQNPQPTFPSLKKIKFTKRESLLSSNFYSNPVIMHIDMDCFFVSVGLRNRPDLVGKPVAVTHSRNGHAKTNDSKGAGGSNSLSEIASCSYEARKLGIKNGMFMGTALKYCADLIAIPYDFDDYRAVAKLLYTTIAGYTLNIEAVSCDEMYVDVSEILNITGFSVMDWATHIRNEIHELTGCTCSTGFGSNRLQARMATKSAKPAGQFYLQPNAVEEYFVQIDLKDLPGVGRSMLVKLESLNLRTCGDVQLAGSAKMISELGENLGSLLFNQSRGVDTKQLRYEHERKSVSAEVNYGMRFRNEDEVFVFLESLTSEVHKRLSEISMRTRCVTLKLMIRASEAPKETAKYLGHGECDNVSRSATLPTAIADKAVILKETKSLYMKLKLRPEDLRGIGIQLSRLEKPAVMSTVLLNFLTNPGVHLKTDKPKVGNDFSKMDYIDQSVLNELPDDIKHEIMNEYQYLGANDKPKLQLLGPKNDKLSKSVMVTNAVFKSKENIVNGGIKSPLLSNIDLTELRVIITSWLGTDSNPVEFDVDMIANYFYQLALEGKIEFLHAITKFIYRIISGKEICAWHRAYFSIMDRLQQGMISRYGCPLQLQTDFKCPHCAPSGK